MFDNQISPASNQNQGPASPVSPVGAPVAPNQPVSAPALSPKAPLPQDMFSEVEPASLADGPAQVGGVPAQPLSPKPPVFQPKVVPPGGDLLPPEPAAGSDSNLKRVFVLSGLVLAMALIVFGGWYGYKKFSQQEPVGADQATDTDAAGNDAVAGQGTAADQPATANDNSPTEPVTSDLAATATTTGQAVQAVDADDDGLPDEEEARVGTNPNSPDSDNDGLFDREEVKVYGTDPLKADTDGDGFNDGQEVKGGYNPLGWGKLFDTSNPGASKPQQK